MRSEVISIPDFSHVLLLQGFPILVTLVVIIVSIIPVDIIVIVVVVFMINTKVYCQLGHIYGI